MSYFSALSGVLPTRIIQVGSDEAILSLINAGMGITISSRWILKEHILKQGISVVPLTKNGISLQWQLISSKNSLPDHLVSDFLALLQKER